MIRQLLITLLVIAVVVIFYRVKNTSQRKKDAASDGIDESSNTEQKYSPMILAYGIVGFIILFSSLVWVLGLFENNEVLTIRVINNDDNVTEYQVRRKDYQERKFTTIDNRRVRLSDNDRIEIIETD